MKLTKVFAACLTAVMLVMPLTSCGKAAQKKFVVGFDSEFPPMGFVDKDGSYKGFDLELAQECVGFQGPGTQVRQHQLHLERIHDHRGEEGCLRVVNTLHEESAGRCC